jgi:hypothetical protein
VCNGLVALENVPYFFTGEVADAWSGFIVQGDAGGMREVSGGGIGFSAINLISRISSVSQTIIVFIGPMRIGPGKFQFHEHVWPMVVGNLCGVCGPLVVIGLGDIGGIEGIGGAGNTGRHFQ